MTTVESESCLPFGKAYVVFVRGQRFTLSRSQIQFDSPNYFTDAFLGEFAESTSRVLHLWDRNPDLFAIIVEYLSGYDILPLNPEALPKSMSVGTATRNLAKDADYLGLGHLSELIAELDAPAQATSLHTRFLAYSDLSANSVEFDDLLEDPFPTELRWNEYGKLVGADGRAVVVHAQGMGVTIAKAMTLSIGTGSRAVGFPPARPELGWKLTDADLRAPRFLNVGGILPADALVSIDGASSMNGTQIAISESSGGTYGRMGRLWVDDAWFTLSTSERAGLSPSDRVGLEGRVWDGELLVLRARQRAAVFLASLP